MSVLLRAALLAILVVGAKPSYAESAATQSPSSTAALAESAAAAATLRARGFRRQAATLLGNVIEASPGNEDDWSPDVVDLYSSLLFETGQLSRAAAVLNRAIEANPEQRIGHRLVKLAVVEQAQGKGQSALAHLRHVLGRDDVDAVEHARARLNLTRIQFEQGQRTQDALVTELLAVADAIAPIEPAAGATLAIAFADLIHDAQQEQALPASLTARTQALLRSAIAHARDQTDDRTLAATVGRLARVHLGAGNPDRALILVREAVLRAQQADAYDELYAWEFLAGRIYRALGRTADAEQQFRQAVASLEVVRTELINGSPYGFRRSVEPLYLELADVVLQRQPVGSVGTAKDQEALRFVRDLLERSKSAEIEDYFKSECVLPDETVAADVIAPGTATVYPILLKDRVETLVGIGDELFRFSTPAPVTAVTELIYELREFLEEPQDDTTHLELGGQLYDWLLAPARPLLAKRAIETLVLIPSGPLRTVPLSVLHDGDGYLIETFALATTPALRLTAPHRLAVDTTGMFAGGLSEGVQGFSPLPGVTRELTLLNNRYSPAVLRDSEFTRDNVASLISNAEHGIVHVATHGHFDSDPDASFLLTYDTKFTMNELERAVSQRTRPIELLVLSACETAAGDDRAALGLAGVALKAGANAALATLWQINDAATVRLIGSFYEALQGGATKAEALRRAQLNLLAEPRFSHPSDWAPFLVIGNWL